MMQVRLSVAALGAVLILGSTGAESAQAQNVSYSVIPTYQEIRWDDAFGFDRIRLFGVRASVDFGPYFSLQPFYSWKDDIGPRDDLTPADGEPELWDMELFGADFMVNLGRGSLVPFIKGGGGVLRISPEDQDRSDRILLRYGGGVRFDLGNRIGAEITAENWTTRLSSPFVTGAVADEDFPDDGLVDSWVYGAGVRIPFGGGYSATDGTRGLVPGIALEPFAARTDFADEFGLERMYAAGLRAGVDFNQNVGLRAYYWQGVDDDFSEWEDVQGYGAEARFALNTGPGLSPFLIAGGGRIRFTDEFLDLEGERPDDLDHLTLGGGLSFGLGDRSRVELGVRNLLMTPGAELEDVTDPDDLVSTWQYSAGLALTLGASPRSRTAEMDARDERLSELERLREENRRLRDGEDPEEVSRIVRESRVIAGDTLRGTRTMVVPVPEVGEIILRYGEAYAVQTRDPAAGLSAAEQQILEERVARALAARGVAPGDTTVTRLQMEALEARLPEMVRQVVREELQAMGLRPGQAPVAGTPVATEDRPNPWEYRSTEPYAGLQLHDRTQLVLGVRAGLGHISSTIPVEVVPELAFGFGEGGTSLLLGVNGRYSFDVGGERRYAPYVMTGLALTNRRFLSVNASYGVAFDVASYDDGRRLRMFVEHQGIQLYRDHRLLAGVSLDR